MGLLVPATAHAAKRQVPRGWLGVVADGPLNDPAYAQGPAEWDKMATSGVEAVRTAFYWRSIEPTAGQYDFSVKDQLVLAAAKRGLGVLPVIQGTPDWAARTAGDPASPPRDLADFARLMTALVTRYGPNGSLWLEHPEVAKQPIRAWQIWNEPNLTRYWNVAPWAPSYVALLKTADKALKAADPGSQTVLAGLPNESWKALEAIYKAGARGSFDVVTLHPYTGKVENTVRVVKIVRRVMERRKDAKMPIWVTELSWPASAGKAKQEGGDFATTDAGQASRLDAALKLFAKERKALRVERLYWYTWLSVEGITASGFDYSGLRRVRNGVLQDSPALTVFTRAARRLQGCPKVVADARRCRT
ncbi:beta-galactosidase [Solirubrobacter phytolaccae]|uniref:Beta-galactosidase n=1 Tax=Solirubrobacter phytolaccae TaxID=1404360 RepID=A0A9X3ND11_9ACTN|nr:beta-galactosidase [Solirubrobacter phytolaccae]MDA0182655.1 beta-galactosidase [Solirubrobacter phytolaccae]